MQIKCENQDVQENWSLYNGDSCEVVKAFPDNSFHYTIFSPPFADLYVYSDSERDMGNCEDEEEFFQHFRYLIPELLRVTKPGRLCSVHCCNYPALKEKHGYIGIRPLRNRIEHEFMDAGWILHSEVAIWKDPVVEMTRTHSIGLLHKQMTKDSAMSRQGIPDYMVTFRKPGPNEEPIAGRLSDYNGEESSLDGDRSIAIWQKYASPVWMDIRQSRTLNYREARTEKDEKHTCPLQLDVIDRCLQLWTNEGDVVLSPFSGIGSEGYCSIKMDRKFVGVELKSEYYDVARKNLNVAMHEKRQLSLF